MERSVAIKKLGKLLGKHLGYRVDDKAPKRDERDEARAALKTAVEQRNALRDARETRMQAILAADSEYQRLKAEANAASDRVHALQSITGRYKFTVGTSNSMFFHVKAQGDTWEEVIGKLNAKESVS
jgi:predicted  nucleic acid-binding Zn-ribbon protein